MNQRWRVVLFAIVLVSIFFLQWFDFSFISIKNMQTYAHEIELIIAKNYVICVLTFILSFASATVLCLPITAILTIVAGYFFGIFLGALYVLLGILLGSALVFMMVRYVLGQWLQKKYASRLDYLHEHIKKYGVYYIIIGNILPGPPMSVYAFVSALSPLHIYPFLFATLLGILPGTLVYTWAGDQMHIADTTVDIMFVAGAVLIFFLGVAIISLLLKRFSHKT